MKNQYVGDVNDYVKYALLRTLTAPPRLTLTVAWLLTRDDGRSDGRKIGYLARADRFRQLDPPLFDSLGGLVTRDRRNVQLVAEGRLIPTATFFTKALVDDRAARRGYFDELWVFASSSEAIFFDPDNGLGVASVRKGRLNSSKYIYWDELEAAYRRGHSLIVYQHFPRRPREVFLSDLRAAARSATGAAHVDTLATANVAFLVIAQPRHEGVLDERLGAFSARLAPLVANRFAIDETAMRIKS